MPERRLVRPPENSQNHRVRTWPKSWHQVVATARDFFRRHWQELLRIREKLRLSEETVHLLLAAGVGSSAAWLTSSFIFASTRSKRSRSGIRAISARSPKRSIGGNG